jgi:hypothetical protein
MRDIRFTTTQREALKKLGLLDEQISELQSILPGCAAMLSKPASLPAVRDKLKQTTAVLERAERALIKIVTSRSDANLEVRNRVIEVDFAVSDGTDTIEAALAALVIARESFAVATGRLRAKARHKRTADYRPIEWIGNALLHGFIKHHHRKAPPPGRSDPILPAYTLTVSRSAPFSTIAAICYVAIGELDGSRGSTPDRAIREYLRLTQLRKRRREERQP